MICLNSDALKVNTTENTYFNVYLFTISMLLPNPVYSSLKPHHKRVARFA